MFNKILIANRGEIACRIVRTARKLGVATVAVYSDADAEALHVRLADQAVWIGPAPAPQSYLRAEAIIEAARQTGATAIHPGYGFLSEQAAFGAAVEAAGITFIGPAPETLASLGDKLEARRSATDVGVPIVPGMNSIGRKATIVVSTAKITGLDIWLAPRVAASRPSFRPGPLCRWWWMFSATTMASSTTMPSTMMNAKSEIMLTDTSW